MATYDLHQHLWPEAFVAALRVRKHPPRLTNDELVTVEGRFPIALEAHVPANRVRALDRDAIDVAVLSLQASLGLEALADDERRELEEIWSQGAREIVADGGGRFLGVAPSSVRDGFVGVSLDASSLLDLDSTAPLLDEAARRDCPVFVHPEAAPRPPEVRPSWWTWVVDYPRQMQASYLAWLASGRVRWPTVRIVFALLAGGAPFQLERLTHRGVDVRSALDPNVFFDVASYGRRSIELCIETFGVTQLVYGSDTPVIESGETLRAVRGFGDSVTHILQTETPTRLLR